MSSNLRVQQPKLTSGRSLLVNWANQQDHWLRAMVSEIFEGRSSLTADQIDYFYNLLLVEKGLAEGTHKPAAPLEDKDRSADAELPLCLASIKDVENVNALSSGQQITFNPRLTIIFGENAAGKSGYARILKGLAAVRTAESILSNISKPQVKPKATVSYWLGTDIGDQAKSVSIEWNGEHGIAPLTRMDVFDSRGVSIHVDNELAYVYTPAELSLFPLITEAIEQIKLRLEKAKSEALSQGNQFLTAFKRQGQIYPKIETLGASTNLTELQKLSDIKSEDEAGLEELSTRVDALRADNTEASLQLALNEELWLKQVQKTLLGLSSFNSGAYNESLVALASATESYENASVAAFSAESIPGLTSSAWSQFIKTGETYIAEFGHEHYPAATDVCIYCRQELSAKAVALIAKYRDYCNNALQQAVSAARKIVESQAAPLLGLQLERFKEDCDKKANELTKPLWFDELLILTNDALLAKSAVLRHEPLSSSQLSASTSLLESVGISFSNTLSAVSELKTQGTERTKAFNEELQKLWYLQDRIALRGLLPSIVEFVERAQWADKANSLVSKFRGVSKSLTDVAKIASEELLNQDFANLFLSECENLKAPAVAVDFSGKRGLAARKKSLASGHKLSDVLSEGEQKVIALADFIAESSLRRKSSPIIFDDPVNSLDYKRLKQVVDRICDLSRTRQVIIFTHNIWFATEILSRFDKDKQACSYYDIFADGDRRGLISGGTSPRTDSFDSLRSTIKKLIAAAEKDDTLQVREALVRSAYDSMRAACEVIVEQDLFQDVTRRYRANMMMTRLPAVNAERLPAAIAVLKPIFDKCCDILTGHSHALETLNVRPKLDEFKSEWQSLQDARAAYLAKP